MDPTCRGSTRFCFFFSNGRFSELSTAECGWKTERVEGGWTMNCSSCWENQPSLTSQKLGGCRGLTCHQNVGKQLGENDSRKQSDRHKTTWCAVSKMGRSNWRRFADPSQNVWLATGSHRPSRIKRAQAIQALGWLVRQGHFTRVENCHRATWDRQFLPHATRRISPIVQKIFEKICQNYSGN